MDLVSELHLHRFGNYHFIVFLADVPPGDYFRRAAETVQVVTDEEEAERFPLAFDLDCLERKG